MTNQDRQNAALPRRETVAAPRRTGSRPVDPRAPRAGANPYLLAYRRLLARHQRLIRRVGIGSAIVVGVFALGIVTLWWRLANGPIQLDVATPWLASAIEENFGSQHKVQVGGTQIERTGNGGAAVRIRDIVVRDADGTVVASAPKAEVRVSGMSLLSGHMRAESLNLVGAELSVRIERNGDVTVFAGANKHPIATAPASVAAAVANGTAPPAPPQPAATGHPALAGAAAAPQRKTSEILAALLTWIDGIGEAGLDGHDLRELGLKDGNLNVDDARTGKHWNFQDITLSLERPHGGGVIVTVGSSNAERPWGLTASIKPTRDGSRSIELEARHVAASDLLLAARLDDGNLEANLPLSASLRGEFGPDGVPHSLVGRIVAETGFISEADGADGRIDIDHAEIKLNWDAANRVLVAPLQIISGGNRITLMSEVRAPEQAGGIWLFKIGSGTIVLNSPNFAGDPLVLNRVAFGGQFDPASKRLMVEGGDIGNADIGVAMSGKAEFTGGDLRLAAGFAGTRMSVDALKRMWPVFVAPKVRDWFSDASQQRHRGAPRGRGERAAEHAQGQWSAGARRRAVDRRAGDQLRDPAGAGPAGAARCRPQRAHCRPQCGDHAQQGDRRRAVGQEARHVGGHVRSARHRAARAAGAGALQARRAGTRGRGAFDHGPAARRRRRRAVRSGDDARHHERERDFGHAAQGRSAAGLDQLRHHRRCDEFFRRPYDNEPEGRGGGAESGRQQPGL